jgi:beta-glucanase (GH16 family)
VAMSLAILMTGTVYAAPINYADGDLAPLGAPDGRVDLSDYLVASRIAVGELVPTELELSHGDVYPVGAPDGVISIQDLVLLQQRMRQGTTSFVESLALFEEGPATVSGQSGPNTASTTLTVGGWTGSGSVVNAPNFTDPQDSLNTIWHFSVSAGTANAFLGTEDLSGNTVLDSGFDLSGDGQGQLVFDIKVDSISSGATLLVKIDSGWPNVGQVVIAHSELTIGSWQRMAINFTDFVANPNPAGSGVDLENVTNAFVIEVVNGSADIYLDNIFVSQSCADLDVCNATIKTKPFVEYSLIWSDEFDGSQLDLANWRYETGYGGNYGWGNGEWQLYTNTSDNVSVNGGNLVIAAQCATAPVCNERDGSITSGRINTQGRFQFKYGKIQARIQVPVGQGSWPAFWMLGGNFSQVGWPQTGEIDVMEINQRYSDQYTTHFTMHWDDGGWIYTGSSRSLFPVSLGDGFHVYEVEWDSSKVTGRIDGIEVGTINIQPGTMDEFLKEFFAILNVAVGGTLGGPPDASTTWPQTMLVDYVRVYQADGGEGTFIVGTPALPTPQAALYSESRDGFDYDAIINSADWSGNSTAVNIGSSAVAPYEGSNVLAANFVNWNRGWGGFVFNFGAGLDFSAYQTLKFAVDTSAMTDFADLGIKIENPGGSPAATVMLSSYVPTLLSNWAVYTIPLSDFTGVDLSNLVYLGFWSPLSSSGQLTFGTLYLDDLHFDVNP